jgi:hypothetical protein
LDLEDTVGSVGVVVNWIVDTYTYASVASAGGEKNELECEHGRGDRRVDRQRRVEQANVVGDNG